MVETKKAPRKVTFIEAIILVVFVAGTMILYSSFGFGTSFALGTIGAALFVYGHFICRIKTSDFFERSWNMLRGFGQPMVLTILSGVIGTTWAMCGTMAFLEYIGLTVINRPMCLLICFIIPFICTYASGQSWVILCTLGVALLQVAGAIGVNTMAAAAAIIGGTALAETWTPFGDIVNVTSSVVGVKPLASVKNMVRTNGTAVVISAVVYVVYSLAVPATADIPASVIDALKADVLVAAGRSGLLTLIPIAVLVILIVMKVDILACLTASGFSAAILAVFNNGFGLTQSLYSMWNGYVSSTGNASVDLLLSGDGASGMCGTAVTIVMVAIMVPGIEILGIPKAILDKISGICKTSRSLFVITICGTLLILFATAGMYSTPAIVGSMFKDKYREMGIDGTVLVRILCAFSTNVGYYIPWCLYAVMVPALLGIESSLPLLPFAFPMFISVILAVVFAVLNLFPTPYAPENEVSLDT